MPRHLPRFTVLRLMVAVAIAGIIVGWYIEGGRRRRGFSVISNRHSKIVSSAGDGPGSLAPSDDDTPADLALKATRRQLVLYHYALSEKYKWAARYPWFPVWPDPPEPE